MQKKVLQMLLIFSKKMICMSCRCVKLAFLEFARSVLRLSLRSFVAPIKRRKQNAHNKEWEYLHAKSLNMKFQFITANEAQIPIFIVQIFLSTLNLVKG